MATKTFEELKQMAIQIRDEKTNKQNTATRIGTQMLEHLNKLEQEYYDKTTLDKRVTELNISELYKTQGIGGTNRYTLETAIAQVSSEYRVQGVKVTFIDENNDTETWEYTGSGWNINNFTDTSAKKFSELDNLNLGYGLVEGGLYDFNQSTLSILNVDIWSYNKFVFRLKDTEDKVYLYRNDRTKDAKASYTYYKYENGIFNTVSHETTIESTKPADATHVTISVQNQGGNPNISLETAKQYYIAGVDGVETTNYKLIETEIKRINDIIDEVEDNRLKIEELETKNNPTYNKVIGTTFLNDSIISNTDLGYCYKQYFYSMCANNQFVTFNTDLTDIFLVWERNQTFNEQVDLYGYRPVLAESDEYYLTCNSQNSRFMWKYVSKSDGTTSIDKKQTDLYSDYIDVALVQLSYSSEENTVKLIIINYKNEITFQTEYVLEDGFTPKFGVGYGQGLFEIYQDYKIINVQPSFFRKKKWGVIGDSTTFIGSNMMRYYNLLSKKEEMLTSVKAVGGAGIANKAEMPSFISEIDEDCDFITIKGGINDYALTDTDNRGTINDRPNTIDEINSMYGGVWYMCKALKEKFPNKPIFFILQIPEWNPDDDATDEEGTVFPNLKDGNGYNIVTNLSIYDYWDVIENVCKQWSIPVIPLGKNINFTFKNEIERTLYSSDGLHPSNRGQFMIGIYLYDWFNKNM